MKSNKINLKNGKFIQLVYKLKLKLFYVEYLENGW